MWDLDQGVVHLNHGSFGATPKAALDAQTKWRSRMEANPTTFVINELQPALEEARRALAGFVTAHPSGLVFCRNASTGVASVLRSIEGFLVPGDEVVTTSHDYNAVRQMLNFLAVRHGVRVVTASVPFPIGSQREAEEAVLAVISRRTRLVVLDHITSPTALVFPVDSIVDQLEPEIPVLVDGAHGPGQVPLHLDRLGASWYVGNLHKWVCAPKGSAFLHTRGDRRSMTIPTVISHGWNAPLPESGGRYQLLFDWLGTDDFSPWLSLPDTLRAIGESQPGGWPSVMERNHRLALEARDTLLKELAVGPPAPEEMIGAMASIVLPNGSGPRPQGDLSPLTGELERAGLEVLAVVWPEWPGQLLRISAHLYNRASDYERLAAELKSLL